MTIELLALPQFSDMAGYPVTRHFEATAQCVYEDLPALLRLGDYRAWVHVGDARAFIDFRVDAP